MGAFVRKVDHLGRIVLPQELRQAYGFPPGTPVEFLVDGDRVVLRRFPAGCAVCRSTEELVNIGFQSVCRACLRRLAEGGAPS